MFYQSNMLTKMLRNNLLLKNSFTFLILCCVLLLLFVGFSPIGSLNPNEENGLLANFDPPSWDESIKKAWQFFDPGNKLEILLDQSPHLQKKERMKKMQENLYNFPLTFIQENEGKYNGCTKLPSIENIRFNSIYWQEAVLPNATIFLLNGYYDNRTKAKWPHVRLIGMTDKDVMNLEETPATCVLWFDGETEPVFSKVNWYSMMWVFGWETVPRNTLTPWPYLITCPVPQAKMDQIPAAVSLVVKECDQATNVLPVTRNLHEDGVKKGFAVCVKGLSYPEVDLSARLVEWFETLVAFGADKIFMYELGVHPNVSKVLQHYSSLGKVDLQKLSLPGHQPNLPGVQHLYIEKKMNNKRLNEIIPYNDCLYRNIDRYEYVAVVDIDEVFVPRTNKSWSDMMEYVHIKNKGIKYDAYAFANAYFMDDMTGEDEDITKELEAVPDYFHMMSHVYRSANYTTPGAFIKCFHSTDTVLSVHNHWPYACLSGWCNRANMDSNIGHMHHYRKGCVSAIPKEMCKTKHEDHVVLDTGMWAVKDQVIGNSTQKLHKMGFFKQKDALP